MKKSKVDKAIHAVIETYGLSKRESQVAHLIARGHETTAISQKLNIVDATIRAHLRSIFIKTGTTNRPALISKILIDHLSK